MAPLFAVGGPENANKLMNQYRGLLFPEEKYDAFSYMKKAKEIFEKLQNVDLRIAPVKSTRARRI